MSEKIERLEKLKLSVISEKELGKDLIAKIIAEIDRKIEEYKKLNCSVPGCEHSADCTFKHTNRETIIGYPNEESASQIFDIVKDATVMQIKDLAKKMDLVALTLSKIKMERSEAIKP